MGFIYDLRRCYVKSLYELLYALVGLQFMMNLWPIFISILFICFKFERIDTC